MRVGNYSVLIPEGVERDSGHVALEHGRQYTLRLMNHSFLRCDAEVTVDGKPVGGFRLQGHGQITLETVPNDGGRFTFYSSGTTDAGQAGEGSIAVPDKGLVQVRFVPERQLAGAYKAATPVLRGGIGGQSVRPLGFSEQRVATCSAQPEREEKTCGGITGMSGVSNQQFIDVQPLPDRDEANAVTISLRLITFNSGPRPLKAVTPLANPVPEPV